jgi:hypothetical protein
VLYEALTRTSGTAYDGTWTDSIVLPQGTPRRDGTVTVVDSTP